MAKHALTYEELRRQLKKKALSPVYFFHGKEDFRMEQLTNQIITVALGNEGKEFNLDVVYGSESDARDVISHASSFPMMSERRVVIVREMDKLFNKDLLSSYIERPSASTCLVLLSMSPDFRRKPYLAAREFAVVCECSPLREQEVPVWITDRVREEGKKIEEDAARVLATYTGTSMREIQNELDKLYLYVGDSRAIAAEDVRAVAGMSREFNVFELQKAIGAKDGRKSVEILERMLDRGEDPLRMAGMLTRYFAALWKLSDAKQRGLPTQEQARILGTFPSYLKDYEQALNLYTTREIESSFDLFATTDLGLKLSGDPRQLLNTLVVQLVTAKGSEHTRSR